MLSEIELKRVEKSIAPLLELRERPHVKSGGQANYRVKGHEVLLFTSLPSFRAPEKEVELGVAKFKFIRKSGDWRLYWYRANGRWQSYEPFATSKDFNDLAQEVLSDPYGCFWG